MQPKDRRLVTEQKLDTALGYTNSRLESVEAMAGLEPGEVTDAQTSNLIQQYGSLTHSAISATIADPSSTVNEAVVNAVGGVIPEGVITSAGITQIVTTHARNPAPLVENGTLVISLGTPPEASTTFTEYGTGAQPIDWSPAWQGDELEWVVDDGALSITGRTATSGRRALIWDLVDPRHGSDTIDVLMRWRTHNDPLRTPRVIIGAQGATENASGIAFGLSGPNLTVSQYNDGAFSIIREKPAQEPVPGVWYYSRIRVDGNDASIKNWAADTTEPQEWGTDVSSPHISAQGELGIFLGGPFPSSEHVEVADYAYSITGSPAEVS